MERLNSGAIEAKASATIVLLRDGTEGLEVFIMVRADTMAFGAGAAVFPGGKVDKTDSDILAADPLGAYKVAALRETFEEAGGLLATRDGRPLTNAEILELEPWRTRLEKHELGFTDFCAINNLQPDFEALSLISRWRTPKHLKKRFDTYFFLAVLLGDQSLAHDGGELVSSLWQTPQTILELHDTGDLTLMPPTYWTLQDLCRFGTADEAVVTMARHSVEIWEPVVTQSDDHITFQMPDRETIKTAIAK